MDEFARKIRACFISICTCAVVEIALGVLAYKTGYMALYIGCFATGVISEFLVFILSDIRANKRLKEIK